MRKGKRHASIDQDSFMAHGASICGQVAGLNLLQSSFTSKTNKELRNETSAMIRTRIVSPDSPESIARLLASEVAPVIGQAAAEMFQK